MVVQYVSKVNQKEGRKGAAKIVGEHAVNNGANLGYEIAFFRRGGLRLYFARGCSSELRGDSSFLSLQPRKQTTFSVKFYSKIKFSSKAGES